MKKLLFLLKALLFISLVTAIAILTFGLVLWINWPWWIGICFILVYVSIYLVWVLIRKILLRRREKQFVSDVIAQDEAYRKNMGSDSAAEQDLQVRWKEAIDILNQSRLGKSGNPLYVLPWYMVIGESHSGKTTAIKSARLSAPFAKSEKISGLAGTKNCDWWFFEQAVILDTAGRYTIPLEEGRDRKEWQKFLSLLARYRKKEALNGLVVTIAADKLLQSPQETIIQDGQSIRQRIDELMRVLGIKFPVYVLVTKCDLVQGMTTFCDSLPPHDLDQAMGIMNRDLKKDVGGLVRGLFRSVSEKLRSYRLQLFGARQARPELLLFPHEFAHLESNLKAFTEAAFKESTYQETPLLRGIYFSSGRQEGTPYSHFLNALGLIKQQNVLPGTNRGFFLHDLFASIMAQDRAIYAPTGKALAWSKLTKNIGLMAWAAIILSLCGLLSFSFIKNLTTLRTAAEAFTQPVALRGEILSDTAIMERYQQGVIRIEEINNSWWFPRLGLNESLLVESRIKKKFCAQYRQEFSTDFERQLAVGVSALDAHSPEGDIVRYVIHLTRRINLLQARLAGRGMDGLAKDDQPSFQIFISAADSKLVNQISDRIASNYLHYLAWQTDEHQLASEMKALQQQLHHVLTLPDTNLNWLVAWLNEDPRFDYLTLEDFWGATLERQDLASVPPAFTGEGKQAIETLINHIERALPDYLAIAANKTRFGTWYGRAYEQIWFDFASAFPQAEYYLRDREAWRQTASMMALDNGPYFSLLSRMHKELGALDERQQEDWIALLHEIERSRLEAKSEKAIQEKKSMLAAVAKKSKKAISSLEKGLGTDLGKSLESQLLGGVYFNDYRNALSELVLAASSRNVSLEMATVVFKEDPATSKAPMYEAQRNLILLRHELADPGAGKKTMVIWKLIAGPLSFLREYAFLEAACGLNSLWEEKVLVEVQDIKDKTKLNDRMFEENGLALQFINGPAGPFLGRNLEQGFYPREALERKIPFRPEFLTFLSEGIRLSKYKPEFRISDEVPLDMKLESDIPPEPKFMESYRIVLKASPTSVNKEAEMMPHAVSLEMICGAEVTRLVNHQYPVSHEFNWKPKQCQVLALRIEIGSLVLEKKYEDEYSFARFIKDYESGEVIYSPLDFPEKEKQLKRRNIRTIAVKFKAIEGGQPLLAAMDQLAARQKALGLDKKKPDDDPNVAELLMSLEDKRKAEELENEAMKRSWKNRQLQRAAEIKRNWEEQLPLVPRDITICWD